MSTDEGPWLATPPGIAEAYREWTWRLAYEYEGHSVVYRLSRDEPDLFLKMQPVGAYPSLPEEAERTSWARPWLPVPKIVGLGSEAGVAWMVSVALPGVDATHPDQRQDPERLARVLARGLRQLHDRAPAEYCPFDSRLETAVGRARHRLGSGLTEEELDFHDEFRHLSADEAMQLLEDTRPPSEDIVVCHGDYCLPNALIDHDRVVGYVDLGELGVACRWWDLSVASWSLTWNLGAGYEELFLEEYGVSPDPDRMAYYRLLYDAVS